MSIVWFTLVKLEGLLNAELVLGHSVDRRPDRVKLKSGEMALGFPHLITFDNSPCVN